MFISIKEQQGIGIIKLSGTIDASSASEIHNQLLPLALKHDRIILDVTDIGEVSSVGLRKILMLYRTVKVRNGQILFVGLSHELYSIMWAAGFLNYFIVAESLDMAIAAFD